jgi:pimeloyl-ACP methyl ester carboxylesterase
MSNTSTWADSSWTSDGLRLHYRDYAGPKNRPALLCMPGLTRNIRDFEPLIAHLAGDWRIIAVEFRGRGESEYSKAPASYAPPVYAQDVALLIEELKLRKIVTIGTSLGGLVSMMLAAMLPDRIVGAVLNDIGPVVEQRGLDRIKSYVGKAQAWPTWVHAARAAAEQNADVYPGYDLENWIAMAKRLNTLTPQGRVVPDYDPRIAEPIRAEQTNAVPPPISGRFTKRLAKRRFWCCAASCPTYCLPKPRAPWAAACPMQKCAPCPTWAMPRCWMNLLRCARYRGCSRP